MPCGNISSARIMSVKPTASRAPVEM
jgi:hypothetical protein